MVKSRAPLLVLLLALAGLLAWRFYVGTAGQRLVNGHPNGRRIIAFGEDLASGVAPGETFTELLARQLKADVVNLAKEGDTTAAALTRIDAAVAAQPNVVLLTLGPADLAARIPLDETLRNLDALIHRLQGAGALVVFVDTTPPGTGDNWPMALRDTCRSDGVLWIGGALEGIWADPTLVTAAGRPNGKGNAVLAARVAAVVEPYLP